MSEQLGICWRASTASAAPRSRRVSSREGGRAGGRAGDRDCSASGAQVELEQYATSAHVAAHRCLADATFDDAMRARRRPRLRHASSPSARRCWRREGRASSAGRCARPS